jgi:hypothetical protein
MLRTIWTPDQTAGSANWNAGTAGRKDALIRATSRAIPIPVIRARKNLSRITTVVFKQYCIKLRITTVVFKQQDSVILLTIEAFLICFQCNGTKDD